MDDEQGPGGIVRVLDAPPRDDVVEVLAELLERARDGHIRSVAIAWEARGSGTGSAFALGDGDLAHLVCAQERLKLRLLDHG